MLKMEGIQTLKGSWPWPSIRPYRIPSCITHRPVPIYRISWRWEEKKFRKSTLKFRPSSKSRDTKTRANIKNPARQIQILCPSLSISGHLPAAVVNGGGDRCWKWKEFKLWRARDLDLQSGHTAYRRASLIDLYLYTNFHEDRKKKNFESQHWRSVQVQSHVTQKLGQISKIRPDQICALV